jgi:hypothetical protein
LQEETFNAPQPAKAGTSIQELAEGVRGLLTVFADRGFMIRGEVTDVTPSRSDGSVEYHGAGCSGGTFRVRLEGPAHLWGEPFSLFLTLPTILVICVLGMRVFWGRDSRELRENS